MKLFLALFAIAMMIVLGSCSYLIFAVDLTLPATIKIVMIPLFGFSLLFLLVGFLIVSNRQEFFCE